MLLMTGKMTIWIAKSSRLSYSFDLIFLGCRFQVEGRGKMDATAKDYPLTLATCSILVYFVVELPCICTCVSVSTLVHVPYLFEGDTALFQLEYFTKTLFTQLLLHLKLCILFYCYIMICISLQQCDQTNFEGVIALFDLKYCINMYMVVVDIQK